VDVVVSARRLSFAALVALAACAPASFTRAPSTSLHGSDGRAHDLAAMAKGSRALVVTFFSPTCPCQAAHDARLRALSDAWSREGVAFVAVDADEGASPARDAAEARARGYAFPILTDARGDLADALGADVATYSVVFDGSGRARYRGGIDSDWTHVTADAEPWLDDAIRGVVHGGSAVADHHRGDDDGAAEHRALGCPLRRP
jgi:hypothetical protein